jgi:hypothetical protein
VFCNYVAAFSPHQIQRSPNTHAPCRDEVIIKLSTDVNQYEMYIDITGGHINAKSFISLENVLIAPAPN